MHFWFDALKPLSIDFRQDAQQATGISPNLHLWLRYPPPYKCCQRFELAHFFKTFRAVSPCGKAGNFVQRLLSVVGCARPRFLLALAPGSSLAMHRDRGITASYSRRDLLDKLDYSSHSRNRKKCPNTDFTWRGGIVPAKTKNLRSRLANKQLVFNHLEAHDNTPPKTKAPRITRINLRVVIRLRIAVLKKGHFHPLFHRVSQCH